MRTSTAYFAGVGTVVAAIAVGCGGGFMIANTVNPQASKQEISRLDRKMSAEPSAKGLPTPSDSTPYLAATEAASKPVSISPAPQTQQEPPKPVPQQAAQSNSTAPSQPETTVARDVSPPASASPARSTQGAREQSASAESSNARANESDLKQAAAKKRRVERRQQWAERRRLHQDDELRDVVRRVREETEGPAILAADPGPAAPRIGFFGASDD
jgi:hypothetical protein